MTVSEHRRQIKRKLKILKCSEFGSNVSKKCRHYGISRETYYKWKRTLQEHGEEALKNSKPCPENHKLRTPKPIKEKILESFARQGDQVRMSPPQLDLEAETPAR